MHPFPPSTPTGRKLAPGGQSSTNSGSFLNTPGGDSLASYTYTNEPTRFNPPSSSAQTSNSGRHPAAIFVPAPIPHPTSPHLSHLDPLQRPSFQPSSSTTLPPLHNSHQYPPSKNHIPGSFDPINQRFINDPADPLPSNNSTPTSSNSCSPAFSQLSNSSFDPSSSTSLPKKALRPSQFSPHIVPTRFISPRLNNAPSLTQSQTHILSRSPASTSPFGSLSPHPAPHTLSPKPSSSSFASNGSDLDSLDIIDDSYANKQLRSPDLAKKRLNELYATRGPMPAPTLTYSSPSGSADNSSRPPLSGYQASPEAETDTRYNQSDSTPQFRSPFSSASTNSPSSAPYNSQPAQFNSFSPQTYDSRLYPQHDGPLSATAPLSSPNASQTSFGNSPDTCSIPSLDRIQAISPDTRKLTNSTLQQTRQLNNTSNSNSSSSPLSFRHSITSPTRHLSQRTFPSPYTPVTSLDPNHVQPYSPQFLPPRQSLYQQQQQQQQLQLHLHHQQQEYAAGNTPMASPPATTTAVAVPTTAPTTTTTIAPPTTAAAAPANNNNININSVVGAVGPPIIDKYPYSSSSSSSSSSSPPLPPPGRVTPHSMVANNEPLPSLLPDVI